MSQTKEMERTSKEGKVVSESHPNYSFFNKTFLKKYHNKKVPFGPLGYVTYKRTYARYLESEGRHEDWWETCARVLQGNFELEYERLSELEPRKKGKHLTRLSEEIEVAYDDMFNLRWLPAGRGLWCSGTQVSKEQGSSLTNCYYVSIKPKSGKVSYPFQFAMNMLMLGSGVGFGVYKEVIDKIPDVKNQVDLHIVCSPDHQDYRFLNADKIPATTHQYIELFDSREGWAYGLKKVIDSHFLSKAGRTKTLVVWVQVYGTKVQAGV